MISVGGVVSNGNMTAGVGAYISKHANINEKTTGREQ
jgi:hypothetical protein